MNEYLRAIIQSDWDDVCDGLFAGVDHVRLREPEKDEPIDEQENER